MKSSKSKKNERKYETMIISRLRTNAVEFGQIIRGSVQDLNTATTNPQGYSFYLNYPSYYLTPASGVAQCATVTGLLAGEQKTFDEYKVMKLVVMYLPYVTGQVRVNTAVAFTAPADSTLIMLIDADDPAVWTTLAKALDSQTPCIHNAYEPGLKVCTYKQADPDVMEKWLNLQSITPSSPDPYNPVKASAIKCYKAGYQLTNTVEGRFYAEWTVLFKGSYTLA